MLRRRTVNACVQHFNLYKLPKSKLTNVNILCLVRFGSGRNKLVQLLIWSRNSGGWTIRSLLTTALGSQPAGDIRHMVA